MPCVGQLPYGSSYLPNPGMDLGSTMEIIGESAAGVCQPSTCLGRRTSDMLTPKIEFSYAPLISD
jgi:hypothetical protein